MPMFTSITFHRTGARRFPSNSQKGKMKPIDSRDYKVRYIISDEDNPQVLLTSIVLGQKLDVDNRKPNRNCP